MNDFEIEVRKMEAERAKEERKKFRDRVISGEEIYMMFRLNCYAYKDARYCTNKELWEKFLLKQRIELTPTQSSNIYKIFDKNN